MNTIKRILIVSGSYYPELSPRAYRTTELAEELSLQGHQVTVYIPVGSNDYRLYSCQYGLQIKDIGTLKYKDIVLKGNKVELKIRRIIKRGLKMLFEWPDIELTFKVFKAIKMESGYDILISVAVPYPIHWGVALAQSKSRNITNCWVADCGDPYMGDTTDSFHKLFYFKYIEKWFCRKADYLTVPFKGAVSAYYPEFRNKIRIIPQGFKLNDFNIPKYRKQYSYPVFAYAGGFIPGKRDPKPLLDFLSEWGGEFKFVIFTSQQEILRSERDLLKNKLEIRDMIPRKELLSELSTMDFLINFDNNVKTQLPSKLIDYSIVGRPVLNIIKNDNFNLLMQFLEGDYTNKMKLEPPETYNIKRVAEQFLFLCGEK